MRVASILGVALLVSAAAQPPAMQTLAFWTARDLQQDVPVEAFDGYGISHTHLATQRVLTLAMNDNARFYVLDLLAGEVLAEVETPHPGEREDWWTRTLNGVAVGDMDDDAWPDILVLNTGGYLTRLERTPGEAFALERHWSVFAYAPRHDPGFWESHPWLQPTDPAASTHLAHGHAFLARPHADADGQWAYVQSDDLPGVFAFNGSGNLQWMDAWHDGHAGPWVGDLAPDATTSDALDDPADKPAVRSALFATDAGLLVARDAQTGREQWVFTVPEDVRPGGFQVPPGVADIDGDGDMELLAAARMAVREAPTEGTDGDHNNGGTPGNGRDNSNGTDDWMEAQHARIFALDHTGQILWSTHHPSGDPLVHAAPVAHDVQGDGVLDWILLDWNTIGRKPGNFERLGPGNLFALDGTNGTLLWSAPVDAPSTDHDFPVADFAGRTSALVPHQRDGKYGIATVDVADGQHIAWQPLPEGWSPTRGVSVADLDQDGRLEAVTFLARPAAECVPKDDVPCREGAVVVHQTRAPAGSLVASGAHTRSAEPLGPAPEPVAQEGEAARTPPPPERPGPLALLPALGMLAVVVGTIVLLTSGRQRP